MRREQWADAKEGREAEDYRPEMPPCDALYLVSILFEIGPVLSAGMGAAALTFDNIDAWCRRIGTDLTPWESRTLVRLSREYAAESKRAEKLGCSAPWAAEGKKPELTALQLSIRNWNNS